MKVDHVLILAAGKGTRMGEIGKSLPKVLWPIFEKSLLELQVEYAKKLAPSAKIYINYFNYKKEFEAHISNNTAFEGVIFIEEHEKLDIGGAVHNLASQLSYEGNLLILNSDQFVYIKKEIISRALLSLEESNALLFSYKVNSSDMYNALDIKDSLLVGVINNSLIERDKEIETYTGMSLIRLDTLKHSEGESKFFESVILFNSKAKVLCLGEFEYWDFGTTPRYYNSIFKLFNTIDRNTGFLGFLFDSKAIIRDKVTDYGYNSISGLNFSNNEVRAGVKDIIIAGKVSIESNSRAKIVWNETIEYME